MNNLLYIGNKLNHNQGTVTTIHILGELLEKDGFNVVYASEKTNKVIRLLDMLWTVFKLQKKTNVVLIDTYSTLNFYYAFIVSQLCRVLKLKYIPILHGGNLPERLQNTPILSKLLFNNAYKNVAPSVYIKQEFEKKGYSNVVFIPNSIQINQYPFNSKSFETIKMLWVRSFSKIYNPLLAIKILKSLKVDGLNASLCMVGPEKDGSLIKAKNFAKSLNLDVIFTGKLSKIEWIQLSTDYNVFINTTNFDNMPVSVMEAMALGLPVISTNIGGMPFLIHNKQDGILVEPNQVDAFVKAIKSIMTKPEEAVQLSINARKKMESYDWEVIKYQWMALLE
tara:strand:- start:1149 stop:2159 length:1011 start_codon:yes stop_codon:yes gene_type:complete